MFRIGLCGTHCAGKTTLSKSLASRLKVPLIVEVAGNFTEEERGDLNTQVAIVYYQIANELGKKEFVSDRTVIDNLAYLFYHSMRLKDSEFYRVMKQFIEFYLSTKPYDLVVFVDEMFPLEDNGIRNLDPHQQEEIYDFIKGRVHNLCGKNGIPLINVKGTNTERVDDVVRWITSHKS